MRSKPDKQPKPAKLYDQASVDLDQRINRLIERGALKQAWHNAAADEQAPYGAHGLPRISDSEREALLAQTRALADSTPFIGETRKEESVQYIAKRIDMANFQSNYLSSGFRPVRHITLEDESKQLRFMTEKGRVTTAQKADIAEVMQHVREQMKGALIDERITDAEAAAITERSLAEMRAKDLPKAVLNQAAKLIPHMATLANRQLSGEALDALTTEAELERALLTGAKPRKAYLLK